MLWVLCFAGDGTQGQLQSHLCALQGLAGAFLPLVSNNIQQTSEERLQQFRCWRQSDSVRNTR